MVDRDPVIAAYTDLWFDDLRVTDCTPVKCGPLPARRQEVVATAKRYDQ